MRLLSFSLVVLGLAFALTASGTGGHTVRANGVEVTAPARWQRVASAGDGFVSDPRTVLVVGAGGAKPRPSQCQIAAHRVPSNGAVVVVVRWKTATSGGGHESPGRWPLRRLISVRKPSFECFAGRGTSASLTLDGHAYEVNVMVGNTAPASLIDEALAVGRSFRLVP